MKKTKKKSIDWGKRFLCAGTAALAAALLAGCDAGKGGSEAGRIPEPGEQETGSMEPEGRETGMTEPGRQETGSMEPGEQETGSMEPGVQETGSMEPGAQDIGNREPVKQEPGKLENGGREAGDAGKEAAVECGTVSAGPDGEIKTKGGGFNGFALTMGSRLYNGDNGENFVCSPISLWLPMAALLNAADAGCRVEALESMGLYGLDPEEVNAQARRMLDALTGSREGEAPGLQIANVVFVDKKYQIDPAFEKVFSQNYDGAAMSVDFESGEALEEINGWAAEHTNGEIPHILEQLDPQTAASIVNAVYFSDRWSMEFPESDTQEDVFHGPGGDTKAEFMRLERDGMCYYEDDALQAVRLGFTKGAGLYILLPREQDAGALYESLTASYVEKIGKEANRMARGTLRLPKFEIDGGAMELLTFLEEIGYPLVRGEEGPITGLVKDSKPLYISQAVQRARIRVDEKGTTAAAVTALAVREMAALIQSGAEPFEMTCDKPFVFLLTKDTEACADQILFSGVVNCP